MGGSSYHTSLQRAVRVDELSSKSLGDPRHDALARTLIHHAKLHGVIIPDCEMVITTQLRQRDGANNGEFRVCVNLKGGDLLACYLRRDGQAHFTIVGPYQPHSRVAIDVGLESAPIFQEATAPVRHSFPRDCES